MNLLETSAPATSTNDAMKEDGNCPRYHNTTPNLVFNINSQKRTIITSLCGVKQKVLTRPLISSHV